MLHLDKESWFYGTLDRSRIETYIENGEVPDICYFNDIRFKEWVDRGWIHEKFTLNAFNMKGKTISSISKCVSLTHLYIYHMRTLYDNCMIAISSLPNLRVLHCDADRTRGGYMVMSPSDNGVKHLVKLKQLESLTLAGFNRLRGDGLMDFDKLEKLTELNVTNCWRLARHETLFCHIGQNFKSLKKLNLGGALYQLRSSDVEFLSKSKSLDTIFHQQIPSDEHGRIWDSTVDQWNTDRITEMTTVLLDTLLKFPKVLIDIVVQFTVDKREKILLR